VLAAINQTPMDIKQNIDSYVKDRLDQYRGWYDKKAVIMKKRYLRGKIWSAVSAVLVPIITNLPLTFVIDDTTINGSKILGTILATLVALLIALEGVLHYREQWKNYRTTEQYLTAQKNLFANNVGDYADLSDEDAFRLLVRRVETAITEENAITLNVLTKIDNGVNKNGG
jgi:hypothetical protein